MNFDLSLTTFITNIGVCAGFDNLLFCMKKECVCLE